MMAESDTLESVIRTGTAGSSRFRRVQNFALLWLDSNTDESDQDFQHSLSQLRSIVATIDTFTDVDRCLDFLNQIKKSEGIRHHFWCPWSIHSPSHS